MPSASVISGAICTYKEVTLLPVTRIISPKKHKRISAMHQMVPEMILLHSCTSGVAGKVQVR